MGKVIERLRRSLGARILLLAALNLVLLVGIGLAASGVRLPRSLGEMVMQSAEPRLQDVARRIALDLERTPAASASTLLDRYGVEYRTRFILVTNDGRHVAGVPLKLPEPVIAALAGPPPGERRRPLDARRPPFPGGPPDRLGPADDGTGLRVPQTPARLVSVSGGPKTWIVLRTPIRFADTEEIVPGSLIVVPYAGLNDPLLFPVRWLWWSMLAMGVTVACWWPLLRGLTRSLGRMEQATSRIAEGRFSTRLDIARKDEVGRLSASIERMADRLGALVSGQKRFLGDTAHELRSPLGRMQVALEILATRVGQPERAYVADLKEDVDALAHLTDELLMYAQAELRDRGQALGLVSLRPIVDKVVAKEGQGADITIDVSPGATVKAEARLLERAIANVIRNAVKYAAQAGPIAIKAASENGVTTITINDEGPGVAADSPERIFDPFFREDAARDRKTGGTGLGLAIVRSAVEACGGTVSCSNRIPHGLEVKMRLLDR
ncbi:MAG: HAMP domain-containing sensor histidine kinase [Acidobacteriota bacterium]|nr:HAMP domain-containing sensor histidine kinase [Acidobacteriota bacterium]